MSYINIQLLIDKLMQIEIKATRGQYLYVLAVLLFIVLF